ncbi:hypothetical protein [Sphingomonas albertensis]|uniref:hypothetical protein n=1 Tax=Sphingomonas albertensis TaxID=2762591 RepID=UPI0037D9E783
MSRTCPDCGKVLTAKNKSGFCAPHLLARRNASAEHQAKAAAGRKLYLAIPANREALAVAVRKGMENLSPAERTRRSEQGKRMVPTLQSAEVQAKANSPEAKAASASKRTATMIHWCPADLIPTYRALSKKLGSSRAAREVMAPMIEGTAAHARRTVLNHQDAQRIRHERDRAQSY